MPGQRQRLESGSDSGSDGPAAAAEASTGGSGCSAGHVRNRNRLETQSVDTQMVETAAEVFRDLAVAFPSEENFMMELERGERERGRR